MISAFEVCICENYQNFSITRLNYEQNERQKTAFDGKKFVLTSVLITGVSDNCFIEKGKSK